MSSELNLDLLTLLEDYTGILSDSILAVDEIDLNLEDSSFGSISAAGHVTENQTAQVNNNIEIVLTNVSTNYLYGTNDTTFGAINVAGETKITAESSTIGAFFGGGINSEAGSISGIEINFDDTEITSAFYGNGMSNNSGSTKITFTDVTASGYIYGGSVSYNSSYTVGDITMTINSGTISAQVYGGSRVGGSGTVEASAVVDGEVSMYLYGGTFTNYIFGGSCAVSGSSSTEDITATVQDGVYILLDGAVIEHELYAGGLAVSSSTTYSGSASSIVYGGTNIELKSGSVINVYGGGYNSASSSIVYGGSVIEILGNSYRQGDEDLIIGTVYGGGSGENSIVEGGSTIYVGGGYALSDNAIYITNIYGGGNGSGTVVNGGTTIIFQGDFTGRSEGNLNISGVVSGSGRNDGVVNGTKSLEFDDFQGTLSCRFEDFDSITVDGYSEVVFTRAQDWSFLSSINYEFSQGEPLDASNVVLSFANDVTFADDLSFTLNFQARSVAEASYILFEAAQDLTSLADCEFTIYDTLSGDSFTTYLGDDEVWSYYGFDISLDLVYDSVNNITTIELICQESSLSSISSELENAILA